MEWKFPLPLTHRSKRAAQCAAPTEWHGRRVREAAPYGRHVPRRTGGHMGPPLRLKRTALITRAVPLIRHGLRPCHLPLKGKAGGYAFKAFPFRGRCPRRGQMRYPVFLNRYRWFGKLRRRNGAAPAPIFHKPRAQWPGGNLDQPLRFCAPEIFCLVQGVTLVMGVLGDGRHGGGRLCRTADCARPLALFW